MKKIKLIMNLVVTPNNGETPEDVIQKWLENSIDGLTHEAFDNDDTKLGEIDVRVLSLEINDV